MRHILAFGCVAAVLAAVSTAPADVAAPDYRGDDNSTCQEWDFLTGSSPSWDYFAPDGTEGITDNPYDPPLAQVTGDYVANTGPGPGGAWSDYTADLFIKNAVELDPDSFKKLRVQATFRDTAPVIAVTGTAGGWTRGASFTVPLTGGWSVLVEDWRGQPNPDAERITLTSPGLLSEVIVDTVCIPEPATLALLAAGWVAMRRKRKAGWVIVD